MSYLDIFVITAIQTVHLCDILCKNAESHANGNSMKMAFQKIQNSGWPPSKKIVILI